MQARFGRQQRKALEEALDGRRAPCPHGRVDGPVHSVQELARGDHEEKGLFVGVPRGVRLQTEAAALGLDENAGGDQLGLREARGGRPRPCAGWCAGPRPTKVFGPGSPALGASA